MENSKNNDQNSCSSDIDYAKTYPLLSTDFFHNILLKKVHPDAEAVRILGVTLKSALPAGENFASEMVRAIIDYSVNDGAKVTKRFILKMCSPSIDSYVKGVFDRETNLYLDVLPKVEALLNSIGDNTKVAPM